MDYNSGDAFKINGKWICIITLRLTVLEIPPSGLNTVMAAMPGSTIRDAGTTAVNWVLFTKVVVWASPFQRTTEPATKLLPLTVRVKGGPRANVEVGLPY